MEPKPNATLLSLISNENTQKAKFSLQTLLGIGREKIDFRNTTAFYLSFLTAVIIHLIGTSIFISIQISSFDYLFTGFGKSLIFEIFNIALIVGTFLVVLKTDHLHKITHPLALASISGVMYTILNILLFTIFGFETHILAPLILGIVLFSNLIYFLAYLKDFRKAMFFAYFVAFFLLSIVNSISYNSITFKVFLFYLILNGVTGIIFAYAMKFIYSIFDINIQDEILSITSLKDTQNDLHESTQTQVQGATSTEHSISDEIINLSNMDNLVCVNFARTQSDKILNYFHPSLNSFYAVKLDNNKLLFHKAKKGKLVQKVVGFEELTFEIPLTDISGFKKHPFYISFAYNIMMPRYELKTNNGQALHLCIFKRQKMFGKQFNNDERKKLLDTLIQLNSK
jgi:hypothetical protein